MVECPKYREPDVEAEIEAEAIIQPYVGLVLFLFKGSADPNEPSLRVNRTCCSYSRFVYLLLIDVITELKARQIRVLKTLIMLFIFISFFSAKDV